MPNHLKRVLSQARLETETFEMMVQHSEREIELNGLLAPNETNITGVHQIEVQDTQQPPNPPKPSDPCYGCGQSAHVIKNCRNVARKARNRQQSTQQNCRTMWNLRQEKQHDTRMLLGRQLGKSTTVVETPKTTSPRNIPIPPQPQCQFIKDILQVA